MNLITRMPPATPEGNLEIRGGTLGYLMTHLDYGGTWGSGGYYADYTHYQGTTPRFFNQRAEVDDVTFKTVQEISIRSSILAKVNYYPGGFYHRLSRHFAVSIQHQSTQQRIQQRYI